jgi:hypothetical protein
MTTPKKARFIPPITSFHSSPSWFGSWSLCVPSIEVFRLGGRYPAGAQPPVAGQGDCAVVDGLVSLGPLPQYSAFMSAGHQICPPPARSQPGNSPSPHSGRWKLSQHPIHETMHLSHCIDLAARGSQAAKLPRYSNPNSSVCPFLISRFWISKNRSGFASLPAHDRQHIRFSWLLSLSSVPNPSK